MLLDRMREYAEDFLIETDFKAKDEQQLAASLDAVAAITV